MKAMTSPDSSLSEGRVTLYYIGTGLTFIGILLFLSVFVTAFQRTRDFGGFGSPPSSTVWISPDGSTTSSSPSLLGGSSVSNGPNIGVALVGMALVVVGGIMRNIGRGGLRGSGVILDPQGAREDLKPWNTASGGMLDDTLRGSQIITGMVERQENDKQEQLVKVRCHHCRALNDEDARFCKSCGQPL